MTQLSDAYTLADDQIATYRRDGHILLREVLPEPHLAPYREAITTAAQARNTETRALADRDTYGMAFLQTMNLWRHDDTVKAFVLAERFAGIAAALMGVDRVRIYHDQALFKEAGGGFTPWHQDQHY